MNFVNAHWKFKKGKTYDNETLHEYFFLVKNTKKIVRNGQKSEPKKNLQLKKKKIKGKNSKNPYPKVQRKKGKIHKQRKEPKPQ